MEYDKFSEPVWVYVGLNVPSSLETVAEAFVFLDECPNALRGGAHLRAMEACRSAMRRETRGEAARAALVQFASERGILAPDLGLAIANAPVASRTGIAA
ncbi:DUF982 domain-containing protein [Aureimonas psammosilenae]|uniref:DUF982 domain-containing protein n=1 Tax=Aureimonas psammosilenae TaxID=2495496 RepID=UPI001869DF15|nr:DUF982 domain-containing protein [Aureimonas psammosilenae]